jgi:hypothetical protein
MRYLLTLLIMVALLPACGNLVALDDEGTLCVVGTALIDPEEEDVPTVTTYEADAPVTMNVVLEECAGGCAEDIEASCSVEREGNTLQVSATASYREPVAGNCIDVCVVIDTQCESEPLPAGTWTVEYAGGSTTFDVPDEREPATLGPYARCDRSPT